MATVSIRNKRPHYYPPEERDQEGNITVPGVYSSLAVLADVVTDDGTRSGESFIDVPEDASDEIIKAAILAQYGVTP